MKITGFKKSEVIGKTSVELGLWPDPMDRRGMIARLIKEGYLKNVEIIFNTKAGEPRYCLWFAELIDIDQTAYLISAALDISEQKRMESIIRESEERFRTLAQISPVGIFRTDTQGRCRYVNERWSTITGIAFEETEGKKWTHFLHPLDQRRVKSRMQQVSLGLERITPLKKLHF